jgi:hypothetical protein
VEGGLFLNVVVRKSTSVLQLFASEDQTLLVGWNARWRVQCFAMIDRYGSYSPLLVLDLSLDIVDGVRGFDLESDSFAREAANSRQNCQRELKVSTNGYTRLYEDLHLSCTDALVCPTISTMESSTKATWV